MTGGGASRHGPIAQLLIALSPLSLILVVYAVAQWISSPLHAGDDAVTNRLDLPLHVAGPAQADRWMFGEVPSVWLQARLVDGSAHWFDGVAALVYVTHYLSIPLVTALAWFRFRDRFAAWIAAVLAFVVVGMAGYVLYPAAPPWLASDRGEVGSVQRISTLGWEALHLDALGQVVMVSQAGSNPVAAMPSLHASAALLVTLFLWPTASRVWRAALVGYVVSMAATLVYTGEHYVVDVLAGWAVAVVAVTIGRVLVRSRRRRSLSRPPRRRSS